VIEDGAPSRRGIRRAGRRAAVAVLLGLATLGISVPAGAATPSAVAPSANVSATPGRFKVAIAYRINRPAGRIARQTCYLTPPTGVKATTPCDSTPNLNSTATFTRYNRNLRLTKAGAYTFTVRFSLKNGRKVGASKTFTIAPGPAVRFSITGVHDQKFSCVADSYCGGNDYGPDFPRQLARVVARDAYGNVATGYTGKVKMTTPGGTFPVGIFPPAAKLRKGVGYFPFVAPQLPSAPSSGPCAAPNPGLDLLVEFSDKDHPEITGCKSIRVLFLIGDPAPNYLVVSPPDCTGTCFEDPTGTIIIDDGDTPVMVVPPPAEFNAPDFTVILVGRVAGGDWFAQPLLLDQRTVTVDAGSLSLPIGSCLSCAGSQVGVNISNVVVDSDTDVDFKTGGLSILKANFTHPTTGKQTTGDVKAFVADVCAPTRAASYLSVIFTPDTRRCLLGFVPVHD